MSFFKKLLGGGETPKAEPVEPIVHEGYAIVPEPMADGGQFRVCGTISREIEGELKTHRLIRADVFSSAQECSDATLRKAKQVIKEQGDRMFR